MNYSKQCKPYPVQIARTAISTAGRMYYTERRLPPLQRFASRYQSYTSKTNANSKCTSYQHLQTSKLPTMYFQRSLPRLPIPLLERTCDRYLDAAEPLLTPAAFATTRNIVDDFRHGIGLELQALLKAQDSNNKHTSYISQPWFDMYLADRAPLPLNYNPLLVMKPDTRCGYQDQTVRASNLVISSLRFWCSLQANQLQPEVYHMDPIKSNTDKFVQLMRVVPTAFATYAAYAFKAYPLDMSQYHRLFGVSRIPGEGKDRLVQTTGSRHILVMRGGRIYTLQVLDADGKIESPHLIYRRICSIVRSSDRPSVNIVPLGALTAGERNAWAANRHHLELKNATQLAQVDTALFCLCLDTAAELSGINKKDYPLSLYKHLLAGDGTNRWFDKSVSLIVCPDGTAAVNFEHSWGDGVAVLRFFNEIYKDSTENAFIRPENITDSAADLTGVQEIFFDLDKTLHKAVSAAVGQNRRTDERLHISMLRSELLGKNACKRACLSPDALMQLSIQLAYRQAYGSYAGSYESCSTAAFRHGRTETIRPCTSFTKKFCESVLLQRPDKATLRAILQECSNKHSLLTREAAMGQGFDRHLFALKHLAVKYERPLHELYNSDAYKLLNHNIISTSTLSSNALLAGAFGPVVNDGLGIGYSIQNEECGAIVTSYKDGRNGKAFIDALAGSLQLISALLI